MTDEERTETIARLRVQLAEATARRDTAARELGAAASWVGPVREAFGRPFFYSGARHGRPENAEKSAATYTGSASNDVVGEIVLPLVRAINEADRELRQIRERLQELGEGE